MYTHAVRQVGHLMKGSPTPWGLSDVAAAGLTYVYGDEGLADGVHAGEELWHMVMIIGYKISEKEAQAIIGLKEGEPTCIFRFPPNVRVCPCHMLVAARSPLYTPCSTLVTSHSTLRTQETTDYSGGEVSNDVRIFVYACDYSAHLHGNPRETDVELPDDAWMFRITPYGTHHTTTWASIVEHVRKVKGNDEAPELLGGIMQEPGYRQLGQTWDSIKKTHGPRRPGRAPPPKLNELEGTHVILVELSMKRTQPEKELARGTLLRHGAGEWWVGPTARYLEGIHRIEATELPERVAKRGRE
jgi:hypothetical protein